MILALLAHFALAQEPADRARTLFLEGREAYNEGRYEDAIPLWEEAWRLSMRAELLYNLANAYERAGRLEDALEQLRRYQPSAPAEEAEPLAQRITNLEVRVAAFRAEADRLAAEQARREAELLAEKTRLETEMMNRPPLEEEPRGLRWWVPVGAGAATLGLGTGLVFTAVAGGRRAQLTEDCVETPDGLLCPTSSEALLSAGRGQRALAWTGYGLGAVGIGLLGIGWATPLDGANVVFRGRF